MATVVGHVNVCTDCMFIHANGETCGESDCEPWGLMPGADVAAGDEDSWFSWSSCEACGSTLGGDRYKMTVFSWGG